MKRIYLHEQWKAVEDRIEIETVYAQWFMLV